MKDIPDDVWKYLAFKAGADTLEIPGIQGRGRHLGNTWHSRQELKANMTEAITSALRLMRKESDEWGGKEIITKIWKMASSAMFLPRVLVASEFG